MTNQVTDHVYWKALSEVERSRSRKIVEVVAKMKGYEDTEDMVDCWRMVLFPMP